ncbi:MAG: hypothetical protein WC677_07645 [Clostridia bacterium]|jgi:hypothetical protein
MRWITNIIDPTAPNAVKVVTQFYCLDGQTPEQAWNEYKRFLEGKIIGPPKATDAYSMTNLKLLGYIGVYLPEEEDEEKVPIYW